MEDPVRYLLVSRVSPRFILFYDVSDDTFVLNDPQGATLFKRRDAAESVKRVLGGRLKVVKCMTRRRNGRRVPVLRAAFRPRKRT